MFNENQIRLLKISRKNVACARNHRHTFASKNVERNTNSDQPRRSFPDEVDFVVRSIPPLPDTGCVRLANDRCFARFIAIFFLRSFRYISRTSSLHPFHCNPFRSQAPRRRGPFTPTRNDRKLMHRRSVMYRANLVTFFYRRRAFNVQRHRSKNEVSRPGNPVDVLTLHRKIPGRDFAGSLLRGGNEGRDDETGPAVLFPTRGSEHTAPLLFA